MVPITRLTGAYLAVATLGFSIIVYLVIKNEEWLTGGSYGFISIPRAALFGFVLRDPMYSYYLNVGVAAIVYLTFARIQGSRFGRAINAIREDPDAARACGLRVTLLKSECFVIAAFVAGLAGSLYAHEVRYLAPNDFTFWKSIEILIMVVIGGVGSLAGAILGAAVVVGLPEVLRGIGDYRMLVFGAILIATMLFGEGGLAAICTTLGRRLGGTADAPGAEARGQQRKRAMSTIAAHEAWLLEARSLTRRFGGLLAVDGVDLSVGRGSVHGVIGPNGAGKTTLLNLVAGVYGVSSGTLHFGARDITRYSTAKRARAGIRRTFQNLKLFGEMTALENVAIGLHADTRSGFFDAVLGTPRHRREERDIRDRSMEALRFVGLDGIAAMRAGALAYGHRRLLEIARAIVARPALLLLDEPAAGLNVNEAAHVSELIARIRDAGTTVILVEHHMDVVMRVSDEITVLNYGRRLAHGTPTQIQEDPDVIEAYLGRSLENESAQA